MHPAPVISVVIPCYNHGHFLREALESVGTPATATQVVVVDDGSTDSTPDVVAEWTKTHDISAVRQPNAGLARARNRGLQESRGRYVVFLDADDRLAPGALDLGAGMLDAHPECAFVFGRCQMMTLGGELQPTRLEPRILRDHYRELLRRNFIWMPATVMFRRDAVEHAGGFNPAVNAAADYEIYLRIARHHPVHDHAQLVAHYRRHPDNMSSDGGRMLRETLTVLRSQRPFLAGDAAALAAYDEGCRHWQDLYGAQLSQEIRAAVRNRRWGMAARKAAMLGRYHPRGLWHHARRKAFRVVKGIPPESHP